MDRKGIERLCRLARVSFSEEEKERLEKDILDILDWMKALGSVPDPKTERRRSDIFRS